MSDPPRIAVVIVTHNSDAVLPDCLRSLPAGARGVRLTDVVVADNASAHDPAHRVPDGLGLAPRVLRLGRNTGYAAAINAGVAALDDPPPDAVFVMNPDCRLHPGSLAALAAALRTPRCAMAVPRLVNPDGTPQPSLRRTPTVYRAVVEAVLGGRVAARLGGLGELVCDPSRYQQPHEVAWATGAAVLIAAPALADLGPWDESFLLYSEETEYMLRAADRGWTVRYEPAAVVEHIGGESQTNPTLNALLAVNKVRLFRRRRGPVPALAYYLAIVLGTAARAAVGRPTAQAALVALLRPSRRLRALPGTEAATT